LNSGDWIENLTALEYNHRKWSLYHHPVKWPVEIPEEQDSVVIPDFQSLIQMISPNPSKN
jgi:hypothetical protein